jgi:Ca2+-binding EF-hand superfamily protein
LTLDELVEGYTSYYGNELMARTHAVDIMKMADLNGDGHIDYSEWITATISRSKMFEDSKL